MLQAGAARSFRLLVSLTLPCILTLSVSIFLIHAGSNGDAHLRDLIIPSPDCAAPCLLGIKPGLITISAAALKLQANPIVQSVSPIAPPDPDSPGPVTSYQVQFVQSFASLRLAQLQFLTETPSNLVEGVVLWDNGLQLGDIDTILGEPTSLVLDGESHQSFVTYVGFYPAYEMFVQVDLPVCAPDLSTQWQQQRKVMVGIESAQRFPMQRTYFPNAPDQDVEGWLHRLFSLRAMDCPSLRAS